MRAWRPTRHPGPSTAWRCGGSHGNYGSSAEQSTPVRWSCSLAFPSQPSNILITDQPAYSLYAYPPVNLYPRLRITYQAVLLLRPIPAIDPFTARPNLHSALPPTGNGSPRSVYTPEDKAGYQV